MVLINLENLTFYEKEINEFLKFEILFEFNIIWNYERQYMEKMNDDLCYFR